MFWVLLVCLVISVSANPVKPKRDISQIDSLDSDQIQQIIGIDNEEEWKGDNHQQLILPHEVQNHFHSGHSDHSEWKEAIPVPVKIPVPVTRTITVEKHVPIKIYKPIIIEKKVHVPQKVLVEKRVPVLVERIIENRQLPRRVLPGSNITVSINGVPNNVEDPGADDPANNNGLNRESIQALIRGVLAGLQVQQVVPVGTTIGTTIGTIGVPGGFGGIGIGQGGFGSIGIGQGGFGTIGIGQGGFGGIGIGQGGFGGIGIGQGGTILL